jgi:hypothetical protein
VKKISRSNWLSAGLTIAGVIIYLLQAWTYAHTQASLLDEGNYLYKGYLFVKGVYWPYQDYGPWTNHFPLAFLIPGVVQVIFGPGLGTARYFAIFLGFSTVLGLWLVVRRLGGKWWAAFAVWAVAMNPALIKIYSQAISEGLVACMLVWVFVLVLGEKRPLWQLLLGSALAAALFMTRINLAPVLPFMLVYIFWQNGKRTGIYATLISFAIVLTINGIYYPGILKIWAAWIPRKFSPFLDTWRNLGGGKQIWKPDMEILSKIDSFLQGIRSHYLAVIGVFVTWALWRRKKEWTNPGNFRIVVILSGLFALMFALHTYAALWQDYCVYCYPLYLTFFAEMGLIILAASFNSWNKLLSPFAQITFGLLTLALTTAIGFGAAGDIGSMIAAIQVPRIRGMKLQSGTTEIWRLLANKFGFTYEMLIQWLPTIAGFLFGILVLLLAWRLSRWTELKNHASKLSFGYLVLVLILICGFLLSPTKALGAGYATYDCGGNVIASADTVGSYLREIIPAGAKIYWSGGLSPVPLLYLSDIKIYPPQLNDGYSFKQGGDSDKLYRFGFWNSELAKQWLAEADFILVEQRSFRGSIVAKIDPEQYDEYEPTPAMVDCWEGSGIRIFRRKP